MIAWFACAPPAVPVSRVSCDQGFMGGGDAGGQGGEVPIASRLPVDMDSPLAVGGDGEGKRRGRYHTSWIQNHRLKMCF